jgi:hypothetical protein
MSNPFDLFANIRLGWRLLALTDTPKYNSITEINFLDAFSNPGG